MSLIPHIMVSCQLSTVNSISGAQYIPLKSNVETPFELQNVHKLFEVLMEPMVSAHVKVFYVYNVT